MRYIADSDGYVKEVSFGADIVCDGQVCTEYVGAVPTGYASLEAWFMEELEKLYRWKIVDGNLTLDSTAAAPSDKTPEEILASMGVADYIVEEGTSGSWDYRKWKSGKTEAWRHISASGLTHTGTVLSWYYRGITYDFPTGLFTEVTECFANGKWGSGLSHATARDYSSDVVLVYFLASSTGDMHGSIYAVGK